MSETYSVVIPAYNAEYTIEACLESVIAQTLTPLEVLIIDDASCDGTEAAARRWEKKLEAAGIALEYWRLTKNSGPSAARNEGIRAAKGSYIAFLDADDIWVSGKLAIVDQFATASRAGLLCHAYFGEPGLHAGFGVPGYQAEPLSVYRMLLRSPAQTSCAVVRNEAGLAFDESMRYCEDYDLWMRIAENSSALRLVGIPLARLSRPQLSAGGLSSNTLRMRAGEWRVHVKFCSRAWLRRAWFLPGLLAFSLFKHAYSWVRRQCRLK
jgi:teichuronic acid biosynthesis glycosyltransferase TuaG